MIEKRRKGGEWPVSFLEGGDYDKIRNVTLCATNRSFKLIFVNRLLLSHSKMRAPLIDGILKICSLGDDFEQVHKLYASVSTWSTACQMLACCLPISTPI